VVDQFGRPHRARDGSTSNQLFGRRARLHVLKKEGGKKKKRGGKKRERKKGSVVDASQRSRPSPDLVHLQTQKLRRHDPLKKKKKGGKGKRKRKSEERHRD